MADRLTPAEEKKQVYEELVKPISKVCYMVEKRWWEQWHRYVEMEGTEGSFARNRPGFIFNILLV
jgi:hypothetical protein